MQNPLLSPFDGNLNTIPFSKIKIAHFKPAILEAIENAKTEIESIKSATEAANFENTFVAYERSGELLGQISTIFFNLNSSNTSDEMQQLAQELSPILTAYSSEIQLDQGLFNRIKEAYDNTDKSSLDAESLYLMEKIYKGFVRNGALLGEAEKAELKDLNTAISKLSLKFGENVLKDSNSFEMWIENEADLKGLPESAKEAARMMAEAKGKTGKWLVNLDYPSYIPFMKYAENRTLREKLFRAFGARGFNQNEFNNEAILKEIAEKRHQKALLLGYSSHAKFILEQRMAKSPDNVIALWDDLLNSALPLAKNEIDEVQEISNRLNGPSPVQRWDFAYYSEKLKNEKIKYIVNFINIVFKCTISSMAR